MPVPRGDLVVTVEEEVPSSADAPPRRLKLSMTLHPTEGEEVSEQQVAAAAKLLGDRLRGAAQAMAAEGGATKGPRPDRSLQDLMELYRPRSVELVDALLWEGELTPTEHQALRGPVSSAPSPRPPEPPKTRLPVPAITTSPLARVPPRPEPLARSGATAPRPTEQLLREYDLKDLRDANRARARRVISFEEWSALKAHFEKVP